jgi:cytochrome c oxidase subunit II
MGAVFGLFAGFYYWIEKIVGLKYDQLLAKLHFFTFFVGVNYTFFPMHMLGLAGMPRRVSDYPDYYAGWNAIASKGSTISVIALFLFFYLVYDLLVYGREHLQSSWQNSMLNFFAVQKLTLANRLCFFKRDCAEDWQFGFQDPASPIMDGIISLHHEIMYFLIVIVIFVSWMLLRIIQLFNNPINKIPFSITHNVDLEIVWTTIPSFVLLLIAIPSFSLLYAIDELTSPEVTIKVVGNQWFWTYEYTEFNAEILLDSYLVLDEDLALGSLRLLEVDNRLVLPVETPLRLLITSTDVLHSWAIPSLGVKMDACPGRLNQISVWVDRTGIYYGQCSEICGLNHAYMPIVIEAISMKDFIKYISNFSS